MWIKLKKLLKFCPALIQIFKKNYFTYIVFGSFRNQFKILIYVIKIEIGWKLNKRTWTTE